MLTQKEKDAQVKAEQSKQVTNRVKELIKRNPALLEAAQEKAQDTTLVYGGMKNRAMALQLALSNTIARRASFALGQLDKVNWQEVLA